jgi:hypothetical protein
MKKRSSVLLGVLCAVLVTSTVVSLHARAAESYETALNTFRRVGDVNAALVTTLPTDIARGIAPKDLLEVFSAAVTREDAAWEALTAARPWWGVFGVGEDQRLLTAALEERDGMRNVKTVLDQLVETSPDTWSSQIIELRGAVEMFMHGHAVVMEGVQR